MLKNYNNNDKKISIKLKKLLKNNYKPVENVDDTNLNSTQTDNQADFLALRIIDNLIRFNQTFRLSQVAIKANMGKYNKKGSGVTFVGGVFTKEELDDRGIKYFTENIPKKADGNPNKNWKKYGDVWIHSNTLKSLIAKEGAARREQEETSRREQEETNLMKKEDEAEAARREQKNKKAEKELQEKARDTKKAQELLDNITKELDKRADKVKKKEQEEAKKQQEDEAKKQEDEAKEQKDLEELLNQFDGDSKFPSSFELLLSSYSLIQNIDRNYRDLRPIFNNLSVPVFNDLNDVLNETDELIKKSVKTFHLGKVSHMQKTISYNIDDYRDKFNKIVSTFDNIYNDFQQRKQTFNTNIKTGSGFNYLSKIRNI